MISYYLTTVKIEEEYNKKLVCSLQ